MLKSGEGIFLQVTGAALIEDRRGAGHYQGRSSGVSIPIGLGVRYRVEAGATTVQGTPSPTAIDTGTMYVTNMRVIFQGSKQTRECAFAKLIGFQHSKDGSTTFSVSNRQKPTTIRYGPKRSGSVDFRLDLALAHFRGTVNQMANQLQVELDQLEERISAATNESDRLITEGNERQASAAAAALVAAQKKSADAKARGEARNERARRRSGHVFWQRRAGNWKGGNAE